jgi:hypothetical protein
MFQGTAASTSDSDVAETPRRPLGHRPTGGRFTRWEQGALDLRNANASLQQAAARLVEAFGHAATDPRRARAILDYSLDQAALAHGLLAEFLRRHGRSATRPVLEDESGSLDDGQARARKAKAKRLAKWRKKRIADRKAKELCVDCSDPPEPAMPGHTRCKQHHEQHRERDSDSHAARARFIKSGK